MSDGSTARPEGTGPEQGRESTAPAGAEQGRESTAPAGAEQGRESTAPAGAEQGRESTAPAGAEQERESTAPAGAEKRREPTAPPEAEETREPTALPGPGAKEPHAGNGTVNDGLDGQSPEGLDSDEQKLRELLHQAVRQVEPSDGTLEYLRRAVPARRARKRQAMIGMAAAALFVGTAVPALVHVSNSTGSDANPSAVGHASQTQGGTGDAMGGTGGETTAGSSSDEAGKGGKEKGKGKEKGTPGATQGATEGTGPSAGTTAEAPACTSAHLGPAVATSAAPDSTGAVYGSFRVSNVSGTRCTVTGPGGVTVTPAGAADRARIGTSRHVAGDPAAGLPDPSLEVPQLVLKPGEAYEVKFAWVPTETCPTPGDSSGGPTTDPSPTDEPAQGTEGATTGSDTGTSAQLLTEDGPADGSVTVTYTPATGSGSASAVVGNACAGSVYWTGLLTAT
ncbi:hypothetical protein GCM10009601_53590 [Streptomyces thermospinosisporus]|uniref:DUF4232 domain-containing protein n=1 Tax=Streptomyces thermospinosisporus TaxID=161482 RepID=A0ABN1Z6B9_9ACTN